jgi:NADH-quinone oxidoreductase subunit N
MMTHLLPFIPTTLVILGAFVLLFISTIQTIHLRSYLYVAVGFLLLAFLVELPQFGGQAGFYVFPEIFGRSYLMDDFAILFDLMFLGGAALTLLINAIYLSKRDYYNGEFFALFLFAVFGMMTLAHANDLIAAFISLELTSISIYALSGYHKNYRGSNEAMLKYLILGSYAGALFILGTAILYGVTGTTVISELATFIQLHGSEHLLSLSAAGLFIMITVLFKIGAVPFHAWVLDVYLGSPFPITMFMASTLKVALFAIALRLYLVFYVDTLMVGNQLIAFIAVITLIGGSWLAISQTMLKRMLAGSSIVHGGYMLIALSSIGSGSDLAAPAIMFYLLGYFISSVGAFGILSYIAADSTRPLTYDDFKGMAYRRPYLSAMMAISMLSLSGFPSTIGFLGKFYIFTSAIESGQFFLAGLGIFVAFVSVYYYFKLIAMMYFYPDEEAEGERHPFEVHISTLLIGLMALVTIWGGIGTGLIPWFPGADGMIDIAKQAIGSLP